MKPAYIVLCLAALIFFWNIWGYDLWAPDEPYFGEGAREMVREGQWLVPHVNGAVTTDKPPLFFWLIAIFSLPFGKVLSLTARIPSVLAMVGSVWLTMRLGRRMWGEQEGILAGLMLSTTYLPWDKARSAQIDSLLCFLIMTALVAFVEFRTGNLEGRRAGLLFWCASGFAVLAKGPVGVLLPLGIVLATLIFDRDLGAWRRFAPIAGPFLFFILLSAWALPASLLSGGEYSVLAALKKHFIERATSGMHHKQPLLYYLKVMPVQLLPWTGLIPGALLFAWRSRSREAKFLMIWAFFIILFFTLSTEKRDLYTLPAYPAFSLLLARFGAAWWETGKEKEQLSPGVLPGRRWITIPQGITGALLILIGLALPFAALRFDRAHFSLAIAVSLLMAISGGLMLITALQALPRRSILATAGAFAVIALVVSSMLFPAMNSEKSIRLFAVEMKAMTASSRAAGHQVLTFHLGNLPQAIAFHTDGLYTREARDTREIERHLSDPDEAFAVISEEDLNKLPAEVQDRMHIRLSADHSRMKVLLVSNQAKEKDSSQGRLMKMARLRGFEPPTLGSGGRCSIP